jgi:hypothetical protein
MINIILTVFFFITFFIVFKKSNEVHSLGWQKIDKIIAIFLLIISLILLICFFVFMMKTLEEFNLISK